MKNDGGKAFPTMNKKDNLFEGGMTLRDYFAGQVLSNQKYGSYRDEAEIALAAYNMADAMIKERDE